jgi:hypothetical protein
MYAGGSREKKEQKKKESDNTYLRVRGNRLVS